ncbi:DUF4303 domain-containing protein [Fimbriiglobus ruber]|uniref:Uncharacterized protein n=1 Tax=Fimbriiglobus ruber TaxID=1908690 RepID=A0A225EA16_9BACT|nr:DUF4303 domain-containing protein [Fimbriiglobus ruber]OWK45405.1 hypothetical protein FRUB_01736 [Fimbriiglobus ruber]
MERAAFADELCRQIVADLRRFREAHPKETVYGYGLLGEPGGEPYLASVVATEEGLQRVAAKYQKLGYRYKGFVEERAATAGELATWLRWANPDDGWYFWGLPDHKRVRAALTALVDAGGLGGEEFEEFCTDVLASLQTVPEWREEMTRGLVVLGFTYGSDPRDFLRTATRANPYPVVRRLWREQWKASELRPRLVPSGARAAELDSAAPDRSGK